MIYWAVFTLGFLAGAVASFWLFSAKDSEEEANLPLSKTAALNSFLKTIFGPFIALLKDFSGSLLIGLFNLYKIVAGQKNHQKI